MWGAADLSKAEKMNAKTLKEYLETKSELERVSIEAHGNKPKHGKIEYVGEDYVLLKHYAAKTVLIAIPFSAITAIQSH